MQETVAKHTPCFRDMVVIHQDMVGQVEGILGGVTALVRLYLLVLV